MLIIKGICLLPDFYFRQNIACVNTLTVTAVSGVIAQYLLQMFLAVATQAILHVEGIFAMRILHDDDAFVQKNNLLKSFFEHYQMRVTIKTTYGTHLNLI